MLILSEYDWAMSLETGMLIDAVNKFIKKYENINALCHVMEYLTLHGIYNKNERISDMIFKSKSQNQLILIFMISYFIISGNAYADQRMQDYIKQRAEAEQLYHKANSIEKNQDVHDRRVKTRSSSNNIRLNPDDSIILPVHVNSSEMIYGIDATIEYDKSILERTDITLSDVLKNKGYKINIFDDNDNLFSFGLYAADEIVKNNGAVVFISFRAIAEIGNHTNISINNLMCNEKNIEHGFFSDSQLYQAMLVFVVDLIPPKVTIEMPQDDLSYDRISMITGTVSDELSQVEAVEIQIVHDDNGVKYYLSLKSGFFSWTTIPEWISTQISDNLWTLNLKNFNNWEENKIYGITAQAIDSSNNSFEIHQNFGYKIEYPSTIACYVSQSEILLSDSFFISCTVASKFVSEPGKSNAKIFFTADDNTMIIDQVTNISAPGSFDHEVICGKFSKAGKWSISAEWDGIEGKISHASLAEPLEITVNQVQAQLVLNPKPAPVKWGEPVKISGQLYDSSNCTNHLYNKKITLTIENKSIENSRFIVSALTKKDGCFEYQFDYGFESLGEWSIYAISGSDIFKDIMSETIKVNVIETSGYAIIIQGKSENGEGLEQHYKTADFVYKTFKQRGFIDSDICFLNFYDDQSRASKDEVHATITKWAKNKMNEEQANLYITMVGHGDPDRFFLAPYIITSEELSSWLDTLHDGLSVEARKQEISLFLGFCHSGSFIDELSKTNRLIVASASPDEKSFKGNPGEDEIDDGEYFIAEFFKEILLDKSVKSSFEASYEKTKSFTKSSMQNIILQHPLLDDNGDGIGSQAFVIHNKDGILASNVYIGSSKYSYNGIASLLDVTSDIFLDYSQTHIDLLYASVENKDQVDSIWVEIKMPTYLQGTTEIHSVRLTQTCSYNEEKNRYEWHNIQINNGPGIYQIMYFVRDIKTGYISSFKDSFVYKNKKVNEPPERFALRYPADKSTVYPNKYQDKYYIIFDWEDTKDPDNDFVNYTLLISKTDDLNFQSPFEISMIEKSYYVMTDAEGLELSSTYQWKVRAIDNFGAMRESDVWFFETRNVNDEPCSKEIKLNIYRSGSKIQISKHNLNIEVNEHPQLHIIEHNILIIHNVSDLDSIDIKISAPGYNDSYKELTTKEIIIKEKEDPGTRINMHYHLWLTGDINGDGLTNMIDLILSLQITSNIDIQTDFSDADIDGNDAVGLHEALYILDYLVNISDN